MSLLDSYTNLVIRKNVIRQTDDSVTPRTDATGIFFTETNTAIVGDNIINDVQYASTGYSAVVFNDVVSPKCFNNQDSSGKLLQGWDNAKYTLLSELGTQVKKGSVSRLTQITYMRSRVSIPPSFARLTQNVLASLRCAARHLSFLSLVLFVQPTGFADTLVSPPENFFTPGVGSQAPFVVDSTRILAVYPASDFQSAMPSGSLITQIAFRLDESIRNSVAVVIPDIEIRMSTTPSLVPNFGGHFSDIVGSDEVTVRSRGVLSIKSTPAHTGANPFTIVANLDHPFRYDPRQGNLAVDFFTYKAYTTSDPSQSLLIDADNDHAKMFAGGGDLAVITIPALIMQVTYSTIPEPSSAFLIVAGVSLIIVRSVFRKRASSKL